MVLVFKTNVKRKSQVRELQPCIDTLEGVIRWNVDLNDCDKVLRVESVDDITGKIIEAVSGKGLLCQELE